MWPFSRKSPTTNKLATITQNRILPRHCTCAEKSQTLIQWTCDIHGLQDSWRQLYRKVQYDPTFTGKRADGHGRGL